MSAEIALTRGHVALVDEEDLLALSPYSWFSITRGRNVYAARRVRRPDGTNSMVLMHRELLPGFATIDHINGCGIDNRRANLRPATAVLNGGNSRRNRNNTSGFKGVCWHRRRNKWMAQIGENRGMRCLGYFNDPASAARAYDEAAREKYGAFAALNFPRPGERAA